ncbi:MAG: DNA-3-methyladenine glycosylase I [Pseudomonadota bacterium]
MTVDDKPRCFGSHDPVYAAYHDTEWGVPVHDDRTLFEMLILEGAHAGLSWETVLKKRQGYRARFHNFDVNRVAAMSDADLADALTDPGIVRHRQKVASTRKNAQVFQTIQAELGSFDTYLWNWVGGRTLVGDWATTEDIPASTGISDTLSKDLKKRGMSFVGTTIIYAYMQAIGLVNDHARTCWLHGKNL